MRTTTRLPTTFDELVGAYLTHQLSEMDFQTALLGVKDLPPWLKSKEPRDGSPPQKTTFEPHGPVPT